ncbi:hypothetical protein NPIL_620461 [Nephila pilipes]|uniref:Uncharacterized protein n=1 Tax=Nephila pilipes TaxID=299642 RepID=A0A8X6MPU8_NEPPI|nr:hypothetical protein NPIL_620461 [Nephila pilipes]
MAFIHVPYQSVREFLELFQEISEYSMIRFAALPEDTIRKPNFVLVDPSLYYGSYGGIIYGILGKSCKTLCFGFERKSERSMLNFWIENQVGVPSSHQIVCLCYWHRWIHMYHNGLDRGQPLRLHDLSPQSGWNRLLNLMSEGSQELIRSA